MSFIGISPSDLINLAKGIKRLHDCYKNAPGDFKELNSQLNNFHALTRSVTNALNFAQIKGHLTVSDDYRKECIEVMEGCKASVDELVQIRSKYSWKDDNGRRHWKQLKLGLVSDAVGNVQRRPWSHMLFLQGVENRLYQRENRKALSAMEDKQEQSLRMQVKAKKKMDEVQEEQRLIRKRLDGLSTQAKVDTANAERNLGDAILAIISTYRDMSVNSSDAVSKTSSVQDTEMDAQWVKLKLRLRRMGFDFTLLELYEEEIYIFFMGLYRKSSNHKRQCLKHPKVPKKEASERALNWLGLPYREDQFDTDYWIILQDLSREEIDQRLREYTARSREEIDQRLGEYTGSIRFAVDQITLDEEVMGSRQWPPPGTFQ